MYSYFFEPIVDEGTLLIVIFVVFVAKHPWEDLFVEALEASLVPCEHFLIVLVVLFREVRFHVGKDLVKRGIVKSLPHALGIDTI